MWNVGGDNYKTVDGAGTIQFTDLSLDDSEFKAVILQDEEERGQ
jgi:hypothetical protein